MAMNREEVREELKKSRRDFGGMLHDDARYNEVIDEAVRKVPQNLWLVDVDASVSTSAEVRRYDLSAIADLSNPGQVRRIFLEDSQGDNREIARWQIEGTVAGTVTLELDNDPPEGGRDFRIEYLRPHAVATGDVADLTVDEDWLVCRAMVILLNEADPRYEPLDQTMTWLQYWDGKLRNREAELQRQLRTPAQKVRTWRWA